MKRPAVASPRGSPPKKLALVDGSAVYQRCSVVGKAVMDATGFPQPVLTMLERSLPESLGVPKEERHVFQEKVVAMVSEVLSFVEAGLQSEIDCAEKRLSEADAEKDKLQTAEQVAVEEAIKLKQASEALKTALADSTAALKAAKAETWNRERLQKAGDEELDAAEGQIQKLTSACTETLAQLKEGTIAPEERASSISTLLELGREFCFDPTLLATLPGACSKAPDERGSFDAMVLKQVEKEFGKCIEGLKQAVENGEPAKSQRATEVAAAQEEVKSAQERDTAAKAALEKAKTELRAAEAKAKVAGKAFLQHGPALKQVGVDLEHARAKLEELRGGPLTTFKELVEYTLVPAAPEQKAAEVEEQLHTSVAREDAKAEGETHAATTASA